MSHHNDLVIVIGAGASGIIMAHTLKHRLRHTNFLVLERSTSIGGTWSKDLNNYPGCGVDIPSHFYSFSFNPNPDWSHTFCRHDELATYMNGTVDKFHLRSHFRLNTAVESIEWLGDAKDSQGDQDSWRVHVHRTDTGQRDMLIARVVISAVGSLAVPKDMALKGLATFPGRYWHSAHWDTSYGWRGKRIAIIGNGCSATQMVPDMLHDGVGSIVQFGQSRQWYMPRSDPPIGPFSRFAFRHVPFLLRLYRFWLFYFIDAESITLETNDDGFRYAQSLERKGLEHIRKTAPPDLLAHLIPQDRLGCKRRVNDGTNKGSYLAALGNPRMKLVPERAAYIEGGSIISESGEEYPVDAICFATGYKVTDFLIPMVVRGIGGKLLSEKWNEDEGAHAYKTVSISGFPNFALMFGPNSFPSNNSVIFKAEVEAQYIERILLRPLLKERSCNSIDVRRNAEVAWFRDVRKRLSTMVWSSGCQNWYLNQWGHNVTTFPGAGVIFRRSLLLTSFGDYVVVGANGWWEVYRALDWVVFWPKALLIASLCILCNWVERRFPGI